MNREVNIGNVRSHNITYNRKFQLEVLDPIENKLRDNSIFLQLIDFISILLNGECHTMLLLIKPL